MRLMMAVRIRCKGSGGREPGSAMGLVEAAYPPFPRSLILTGQ